MTTYEEEGQSRITPKTSHAHTERDLADARYMRNKLFGLGEVLIVISGLTFFVSQYVIDFRHSTWVILGCIILAWISFRISKTIHVDTVRTFRKERTQMIREESTQGLV